MLTRDEIERRALKVMFDHLGGGELWRIDGEVARREHMLGKDLGADSLDVVELVMAVEDEFGVEIPDEAFTGRFEDKRVGDFLDVVLQHALPLAA